MQTKESQGYHIEQTKGTTVTKDFLLKTENTVGHGAAAVPTHLKQTAVADSAKSPGAVLSDSAATASYETTQVVKAPAPIVSLITRFCFLEISQKSHARRQNQSSTMTRTSESPLLSEY